MKNAQKTPPDLEYLLKMFGATKPKNEYERALDCIERLNKKLKEKK